MWFEKTEKVSTEWILHIGKYTIPMVALGNFLKVIILCVSISLSVNLGADWAMQTVRVLQENSQPSLNGMSCVPVTHGSTVVMNCTPNIPHIKNYTITNFSNTTYGYGLGN
jgi:hypothetical protein